MTATTDRTRTAPPTTTTAAGSGPVVRFGRRWIDDYDAEDRELWNSPAGKPVARRNLVWSILAENIGFSVWLLMSISVTFLPAAGFDFSTDQLFWLVSTAGLVGAALRVPYTFMPALFGGRNWTVVSALLLLIPLTLFTVGVVAPVTAYGYWLLVAATLGLGGGNFASSMASISHFFPDREKGWALGLNAAGGNIGVAVVQYFVPKVVLLAGVAVVGGAVGTTEAGQALFLQNAALMWVPLAIVAALGAYFFMNNLGTARFNFRAQAAAATRKQTGIMSFLYIGTFGSFIGFSAAFPLLIRNEFPDVTLASYAFLGALVGSVSRPVGGLVADRLGGARVTLSTFVLQAVAIGLILASLAADSFTGFLWSFLLLFVLVGAANGSTYRMIPIIFRAEAEERANERGETAEQVRARTRRDAAAAIGLISAVGAFGGVFIPRGLAESYLATGGVTAAFIGFLGFYVVCVAVTWWNYIRPSTLFARAGV
ncbi:MFS transporter [Aquipuribacter sp. SD81]|uniref:MFS transporter n=1 Tax=Aquipuribacter sp. SD81 TaxID=3127703 RepID=UPI003019433A